MLKEFADDPTHAEAVLKALGTIAKSDKSKRSARAQKLLREIKGSNQEKR